MSYLAFLAVFLLPPIAVLATRVRLGRRRAAYAALPAVALLWTTPWDNYLVARGVWSYGEGRVLGTIGFVPVEEYLFFLLQPLLTGLVTARALDRFPPQPGPEPRRAGGLALAGLVAAGAAGLAAERTTYLGLILVWMLPPLGLQWWYGSGTLWARRRAVAAAVAATSAYLWVADAIALDDGIWSISGRFTTGFAVAGLPVEEAVFFLVTNLLVAGGMTVAAESREPAWTA